MGPDMGLRGHRAARAAAAAGGVWQAQAMARSLGIDMGRARVAGLLDAAAQDRLAGSCAGCAALSACMAHVAAPPAQGGAAPDFCPLADLFDRLRALSPGSSGRAGIGG